MMGLIYLQGHGSVSPKFPGLRMWILSLRVWGFTVRVRSFGSWVAGRAQG